jgi:hypothetical protein
MSKKVSALLALLLLFSNQGSATVVVVIVTPRAIVMGADGRGVSGTPNSLLGGTGTPSVEDKIVLLNGSVLVANVGVSRMTTTDGHLLYHFNRWVVTLAKQTGRTAPTVSMIAQRIRESSFKVFDKELSSTLKAGTFTSLNLARDPSLPMVTYFIAGYEGHKARIFKVFIEVDWKKRILKKPVIESIYPPPGNVTRKNLLFASNGSSKRGIDSLLTKDSPI